MVLYLRGSLEYALKVFRTFHDFCTSIVLKYDVYPWMKCRAPVDEKSLMGLKPV